MRIAIPLAGGKLCTHFGHCECFALLDTDPATKQTLKTEEVNAPPHQPGLLPRWLAERQVNVIIAGGMGRRAQELFRSTGIDVVCGAPGGEPEQIVATYLAGTLATGENACDH
jgi:predicted Fe-Mo cluster-binding NifX family protein